MPRRYFDAEPKQLKMIFSRATPDEAALFYVPIAAFEPPCAPRHARAAAAAAVRVIRHVTLFDEMIRHAASREFDVAADSPAYARFVTLVDGKITIYIVLPAMPLRFAVSPSRLCLLAVCHCVLPFSRRTILREARCYVCRYVVIIAQSHLYARAACPLYAVDFSLRALLLRHAHYRLS